jgi:histone H3/H4
LLSLALATVSKPIEPSPGVTLRPSRHSALDLPDIEDGPDPAVPRLSMALDDIYEDDSIHEAPPRQSLLPELPDDVNNGTVQSLEFGRRALSEDPRVMARVSERFADFSELGVVGEEYEIDGTFINRRPTEDPDQALRDAINQALDDTEDLDALTGRQGGRQSDVDLGVFGDMDEPDEPTFRFTIPPRIQAPALEEQGNEEDENSVEEEYLNFEEDDMDVQEEELQPEHDADTEAGAEATIQSGMEDEGNAQQDDTVGGLDIVGWESENDAEEDAELQAYREEESALDRSLQTPGQEEHLDTAEKQPRRQRKEINVSQFGHEYPSFPAATVKRIASSLAKSQSTNAKISKDTLSILVQTTNLFFEHISGDLAAYAKHARRKIIEDADVVALMKRYVFLHVLYANVHATPRS